MKRKNKHIILYIFTFLGVLSCREPFEVETLTFEDALVIESTITNQMEQQIVRISRTYPLEQGQPIIENNATVWVETDQNTSFSFSQSTDGYYISDTAFKAETDYNYTLFITTQDGKQYQSAETTLTPLSGITNLYAELTTNNSNQTGVEVLVDSDNQNGEAKYFRYEYEETYEVIPPYHSSLEAMVDYSQDPTIVISPRQQEEGLCYTTVNSFGIIQTSSEDLENNNIFRFPIRFINQESGIIRDRYSILVKQYVQSVEAYTFYKTIDELGSIESLLSESQPGNVSGNMRAIDNPNEKVIGYFEVTTVDSKRIYFTYSDFNIIRPSYLYECDFLDLDYLDDTAQDGDRNDRYILEQALINGNYKLESASHPFYTLVTTECTDCTSISSNIRPDWWED